MPDNFLLIIDLRILHARLRETYAFISDIELRYTLKDMSETADHAMLLRLIADTEKIYDWALQLKQHVARTLEE